jgi:alpha-tubulin suppressor-like RCC1 family protein
VSTPSAAALLDFPLEVLTGVCEQLDLRELARVGATCKRFRHGEGGSERAELPTKSPVVTALRKHAFPVGGVIPSARPIGCFESWVAYLTSCARQRLCRELPPVAAGREHNLFLDAQGRLLSCGQGYAVGRNDEQVDRSVPTLVAAMASVPVRSMAAGFRHSLALGWDGRVYSWGDNSFGQLGHKDRHHRPSPTLVEKLEDVRGIEAASNHSFAVTQSGSVFHWGAKNQSLTMSSLTPQLIRGFRRVKVRRVCGALDNVFAIGWDGELFSWGERRYGMLGDGDQQERPSLKRVEALRGVRVSSVSAGGYHVLALAEDGLVYAWAENCEQALLGDPNAGMKLLPKPVEALRRVRVCTVASAGGRSYAVAHTGEVWAWGCEKEGQGPLGHGEQSDCPLLKPIRTPLGIKVVAVTAGIHHTLALADDGSVYAWGDQEAAEGGLLGPGASVSGAGVLTPQRIPELRVAGWP